MSRLPVTLLSQVVFAASLVALGAGLSADEPQPALSEAEQAFVDQLAHHHMVGTFTVDGRDDRQPKEERYEIARVTRVEGDLWTIEARIKYGKVDVTVPVPVHVNWAADTPVLSVTDLTIPLVGSQFSARILFDGGRYAGTWKHGPVGGHMWGHLEDAPAAAPASGDAPASPARPAPQN
jgi:hypothetical protein